MKGQKICPKCAKGCGPRSYECSCGHTFIFNPNGFKKMMQKREKRLQSVKVEELVKGDIIKVKPGSYYESKEGNKYYMGEKGTYTVIKLVADGILAHSRKYGVAYLYMGPETNNTITGTHVRPHRIKRVIKK